MAVQAEALKSDPQTWLLAHEAYPHLEEAARKRVFRFLGSIAIRGEDHEQTSAEAESSTTLLEALWAARDGNEEARKTTELNVQTDVAERLFKTGRTVVRLQMVHGHLEQHGRRQVDIHSNTLQHTILIPEMTARTLMELQHTVLFEELHAAGMLKNSDILIFSPTPTSMSIKDKKAYRFFLDTESCAMLRMSATGDDVTFRTTFVAGKRTPDSDRHDLQAIRKIAKQHGTMITDEDGSDMLRYMFIVPRDMGDEAELYDEAVGDTFYGEAKPSRDYEEYAQECADRTADFSFITTQITAQLLAEADQFVHPLDAVKRLDELSEQWCVKYAVLRPHINAAVFGPVAASHIEQARLYEMAGDYNRAEVSMHAAQQTAVSGSCPLFKMDSAAITRDSDEAQESNPQTEATKKKWMHCPYCSAPVFGDACSPNQHCRHCEATVRNGRVISKGNGGRKKQERETARIRDIPIWRRLGSQMLAA